MLSDQVMTLSGTGEAETPAGGSVCMRCTRCQHREGPWALGSRSWPHLEVSHETAAGGGRHLGGEAGSFKGLVVERCGEDCSSEPR
jgi:hypothetical protein